MFWALGISPTSATGIAITIIVIDSSMPFGHAAVTPVVGNMTSTEARKQAQIT